MLRLSSTYIIVRDMERSVEFYSLLFDMEPSARILDRWAQFDLDGGCFGLFNQMFDYKAFTSGEVNETMFNKAYVDRLSRHRTVFGNNVVHHFRVEDLNLEYDRLRSLDIGVVSEIFFVNVHAPYHYFTLTDPDGNIVELTGDYIVPKVEESDSESIEPIEKQPDAPVKEEKKDEDAQPKDAVSVVSKEIDDERKRKHPLLWSLDHPTETQDDSERPVSAEAAPAPEDPVSLEEIKSAVQDENTHASQEPLIDHSILRAAIQKERERQIREQIAGTPIFKPLDSDPTDEEPADEDPVPEEETTEPIAPEPKEKGRPARQAPARQKPVWEEPAKDMWRDE
ncbi:MAG: VOC family protein [Clostridiales bacterium]|nr:VOC family protein [Clostridiales bacterium]